MKIKTEDIKLDEEIYPRSRFDWVTAYKYAQAMKAGSHFPPIAVGLIDNKYVLVDGLHRMKALALNKEGYVEAEIIKGYTKKQLFLEAIERNMHHGYQFNSKDITTIILKLRKLDISKTKISELVNIPISKLDKYVVQRTASIMVGEETKQVFLKRSLRHLAGKMINPGIDSEQDIFAGSTQIVLLAQVINLLENNLIDVNNKEIQKELETLYELLSKIIIKNYKGGN